MHQWLKKVHKKHEVSALERTVEELFYDFNRSRFTIYKINFVRGIFFGLGSVLGGTVVITILLGVLNFFTDIPGGIGSFINDIVTEIQTGK